MRYLKTIILLWVAILAGLTANAQSANSHTISASGGSLALPGGNTMGFTIGEPVISTIGSNPVFTQGLHQTLLSFNVTDVSSPNTVLLYKAGGVIVVTVTFNQPVLVTGVPELALNSGGKAFYTSGSGTATLSFTYTVAAGENAADLDYAAVGSLTLAGGTIQNSLGANAPLTLPAPGSPGSLGANQGFVIDTTAPIAPAIPVLATASDSGVPTDQITNVTLPTFTGTAEAGSTVTLYDTDGTTVLGTGVATGGNWSITSTVTLTEGLHTITAKATDPAGNTGVASTGLAITIDTTSPTLAITSSVSQLKAGETATITFTFSEDPGTTFTWDGTTGDVVITGGTLGALSGSGLTRTATFTPTAATNAGTASITVAANTYTDLAGNNGGAGTTPTLTFDTSAPNAPATPVLATASDSGTLNSDGVTNVTTPVFTGTAEAGSTVTLYDTDGTTVLGTGVATGGNWSITSTVTLTEGAHTITAKAKDVAGNESVASAVLAITIDTTSPTLAITSNVSQLKAGETATITFTFSEDPGTTFSWNGTTGDVVVTGGTLGAISGSGLTRTATFTPTAATNAGTASITVAASTYTDLAGNNGGAGTTPTLNFDTSAPNAPATPVLATASDSGTQNSDGVTNVTTPAFTGTAEAGSTVTLYDTDGTTVLGTGLATGGNWSITSTVTLTEGAHTITAKAKDLAGNESVASAGLAITIDTTSPTLAITSSVSQLKAGETASITFTFSEDPGATFTWNGTTGDVVVTGGTLGALSGSGLTRTATFTPTASTNAGTASITVAAATYTDVAGNNGGAGTTPTLNFDTSAPNAPATPVLAAASDNGFSNADQITNVTLPVFTGTAEAGSTVTLYDTDGTTVLGTGVATGGNWSITSTVTLAEGAHTITAKAKDVAGNESVASTGLAITIDTTSPTLAITSNVSQLKAGETATITFTFSEDPGTTFSWNGTTGDVVVTGGTLGAISGSGLTRTATFTPTTGTNAGTASITVAASTYTDLAGNNGGAGTTPTLNFDTSAPNAPSTPVLATASDSGTLNSDGVTNVTTPVFTGTAEAGSTVTLYDTDGTTVLGTGLATGGNWSITSTVTLTEGAHTITAKATDLAGNNGAVSTGLSITIDTTSPTLAITSSVSQLKAGETATITFTFSEDPGTTFTWNGTTGDVVVTGGTLGAISGSGLTRTATFTPTASTNGGTVSITVAAATYTDLAGNNGGAGTTPVLTFDTANPNAPSTPVLATASDSGTSNSDGITKVTTPVITGTAEAGSTVTLYDTDGTTVLGTGVATGGNWSITTTLLTPGAHSFTATATDPAGNVSVASTPLNITIDTSLPVLNSIVLADPNPSNATTVHYTLTFSEQVAQVDATDFSLVSTSTAAGTISGVSTTDNIVYTVTVNSITGDGTLVLNLNASGTGITDVAGNAINGGFTTGPAYTFDHTGPTLSAVNILSDNALPTYAKVGNTATLTFTASESIQTPVVTIAGHAVTPTAAGNNWTATYTFISSDTEGLVAYNISFSDLTGNAGTPVTTGTGSVTFDKTPPSLTAVEINSDNALPMLAKVGDKAILTFTSSESVQTPVVTIAGHTVIPTASGNNWTATYTFTASDTEGPVAYNINFSDLAGNPGVMVTTGAGSVTFDKTAPTLTAVNIVSNNAIPTLAKTGNTATLTFTASKVLQTPVVTIAGHTVVPTAVGNNWTASYTFTSSDPDGLVAYNISFSDQVGNAGTSVSTGTGSVTLDNSIPILTAVNIVSDNAVPTLAKVGNTATLTFTSSESLQTPVVSIAGHVVSPTAAGNNWTASYTFVTGDTEGLVAYNIAFTDLVGNAGTPVTTGTGSVTFDKTAPVLSAVTIVSDNATPTLAKAGNKAILTFTSSESLQTPVVSIAGHAVTPTATGNNWTASYTFTSADAGGLVAYQIAFSDLAGNAGTPVTTGTGSVTLDQTLPTLAGVNIVSNNAIPTLAKTGNTATLTFTASEALQTPVVTIAGHVVTATAAGNNWTANYTFTSSDPNGLVAYNIVFSDQAGNAGTPVSTGTGSVTLDNAAPTLASVNIVSNNAVPTLATTGNTVTLTFASSEALQTPVVTIAGHAVMPTAVGNNWTATYTFVAADTEGPVTYNIAFSDLTGNAGTPVTTGTGSVTFDKTPPAVPLGLAAASGNTQNVLSWTANTETDLAKYRIFYGTSPAPTTLLADVAAGTTTYTQTGLTNGTLYYYRILAIDNAGNLSASSSDVSATPKANQTITFNAITAKTYGDAAFALGSVNSSAGLPITYVAADPTIVSVTGNIATILKAGTTAITASQPGNASFNAAANVQQSLVVNTASLTIVNNSRAKVYGDVLSNTDFTGTINGLQNADNITVSRNSTGAGASATAGTYPIVATLADPDGKLANYTVSNPNGTLTITQKALTITASARTKTYGDAVVFAGTEFSTTGLINGNTVTGVTLTSTGAASTATVAGGPYPIVATAATGTGLTNYTIAYVNGSLTVNRKALTIVADDKTKFLGTVNPALTASYNGLVNGESNTVLSTQPVLSTTATTASPVGTYDILVSGAAAANYTITFQKGTLTIKNDVPTNISLAAVTLLENAPAGSNVGTLSSTSDDPAATFTYTLVSGTGATDNASFAISGNKINTVATLDYETKAVYSIRVRSTTANNSFLEKVLTINLTDVNEVPTLAAIANQTICYTRTSQSVALTGISAGPETGQTTSLSVSSSNAGLFDALTVSGSGAAGTLNYQVKSGASGTATVTVTVKDNGGTANGGVDSYSRTFVITVNALPALSINSDKGTQISKGEIVFLNATGAASYAWSSDNSVIGGLSSATLQVRPRQTTTYTVTGTNASGCTVTQTFTITVLDDLAKIKATNILTPNGDGYNDKWIIDNIDFYPNNEVKVFDKAGRLLYGKKGYDNSWDGTVNGSPLAENTYYYIIDFGAGRQVFRGFITVVREK
ncbi:Ig-like domain-containing protein [Pedobacter sp. MC2016-24]|uniref:Ig-like domain-containing protein n=1 Tax=Pedobacter sp. MC2016-24 TaxID=2780090 RepID=UPI00187DFBA4|nr:Ig-like domain-containing protein [Pedobacter sp. MC2016-24]MBE9598553.1 gliding motility-associated C-terminal domain-containing protein [Pedobacter sp. MC2016-24]